ncbi:type II toxin-antitoxin system RelE/ParE family toxin [Notoacmeibacter marinus]|uniref:type II toxin-antitoxin system RelE/ParE family toxin n=1 Tax=Notoacmeibacter marinus TaxID=1876515 RepID=UPI000DF3D4E3|nr:type II toxin-antitoxin system RelE/ParE family toxin [Notoacmeibacter marinus]
MKRLPVFLAPTAEDDLATIGHLIIDNGADPLVAVRYLQRIRARCRTIGDSPRGGVERSDLGEGIRLVPFERSAVILYRIEDDQVLIETVIYGGRDYAALIGTPPSP